MSLPLVEAAKLSNDVLLQGIVETIVKDSPILQLLPFIEIVGNGLTYNQEKTLPTIDFYNVGDTWVESTPTFEQITATLKIMGGDADIDNFLKATRHKFEETFIYGDSAVNAKQFDGLKKLIDTATASDQVIAMGATGATLTLAKLDELIDAVKGGKPELLLMSRRSRRKINALVRAAGSGMMETERDNFGNFIQLWNGIPIGINDWILDTHTLVDSLETSTTGASSSTIYALQFGEGALCGLTAPGHLTVEPIGSLETKDASRTRIKWYVSLALFSSIKAAALIGVTD
ncbi:MAG TPA: phage major capsid protein [Dehalococcoidia bacterium]|nr:phage major capsid protein [Dehalococcoidia bacterium]